MSPVVARSRRGEEMTPEIKKAINSLIYEAGCDNEFDNESALDRSRKHLEDLIEKLYSTCRNPDCRFYEEE